MELFIKEVNRIKTYFGDYNITYYLLDDKGSVLNRCVSSSLDWAKRDLIRGHDEWKNAKIKVLES